ncbi:hypothetical protein [Acinetobacter baumannii]
MKEQMENGKGRNKILMSRSFQLGRGELPFRSFLHNLGKEETKKRMSALHRFNAFFVYNVMTVFLDAVGILIGYRLTGLFKENNISFRLLKTTLSTIIINKKIIKKVNIYILLWEFKGV